MADALKRLESQEPGWRVNWNKATGTPKQVFGPGLRMSSKVETVQQAVEIGRRLLTEQSDLLGLGTSDYELVTAQKVVETYVLTFDQSFRGVEVTGGRVDVRLHQSGVVSLFGSKALQIAPGFSVEPGIAAETAMRLAERYQDVKDARAAQPRLVIHAHVDGRDAASPRLAWECELDGRQNGELVVGRVFVDAKNGELIEFVNDVYSCSLGHTHVSGSARRAARANPRLERSFALAESLRVEREAESAESLEAGGSSYSGNVMGWVNVTSNNLNPTTNVPLPGIEVVIPGVGTTFTDDNGDFSIPSASTTPVSVTIALQGRHLSRMDVIQGTPVTATQTVTPGVPAQFQLSSAGDAEFNRHQLDVYWWTDQTNEFMRSVLGNTGPLNTISNVTADVNEPSSCNATYGGLNTNYFAAGGGCNNTGFSTVVAHELGHGMDDVHGGIANDAGGQVDGLSEGWGDTIAMFLSGQPIVGAGFTTGGGSIRSGLNGRTYPDGGFSPGGAPHPKGEVFMGFNWQVRTNLINSLGSAAGVARANEIVIGSIVADAGPQPDAVMEIFALDDDDGNLNNGTVNYTALANAANIRNLPFPEIVVGSITHTPLTSTTDSLVPRDVRAFVVPFFGSFSNIELVYDAGSGSVRRDMLPAEFITEFRALIDGVAAPGAVAYHFEATHDSGATLRAPEQGDYNFIVGANQVIFSDDFEADSGWTSVEIATQNDWQRGTPTGASGTTFGVNWSDPSAAFGGSNIFGNDLAPPGFNGSYQPNVSNLLRSPTINVAGQSGLMLRFRRWLTVEEGIFDQATIRVNGVEVWANPQNGNLLDTSWQLFELPIGQFDGSPTIQVEFTLDSDGALNLGGWNIDDFEVVSATTVPMPPVEFTITPAQVDRGGFTLINVLGSPNAPAGILLGPNPGMTTFPGLATFLVGQPFDVIPITLDSAGAFQIITGITSNPNASGDLFYLQAFELSGGMVQTSNTSLLLIGN
ncbi:MAG: hypothetical protein AAF196_10580 [Planctomycetota bacterium]